MSKNYEDQIRVWAAKKYELNINEIAKVDLENNYDEGYSCCGGRDPGCYCSLATSATVDMNVTVWGTGGQKLYVDSIDLMFGDIGKMIQEIFEA